MRSGPSLRAFSVHVVLQQDHDREQARQQVTMPLTAHRKSATGSQMERQPCRTTSHCLMRL